MREAVKHRAARRLTLAVAVAAAARGAEAQVSRECADVVVTAQQPTAEMQKRCALSALRAHDDGAAMRAARAAVFTAPNDVEAKVLLIMAQFRTGEFREGLAGFVALPPEYRPTYGADHMAEAARLVVKAEDLVREGDYTGHTDNYVTAASLLNHARLVDSENVSTSVTLAWVRLEKTHSSQDAYSVLSPLTRIVPLDTRVQKLYAMSAAYTGRLDSAIAMYKKVYASDSTDDGIGILLARALLWSQRADEADEIISAVVARNPRNDDARVAKAEIDAARGNVATSIREMVTVAQRQAANPVVLAMLGDLQRWNRSYRSAADSYKEALWLDPENASARAGLIALHDTRAPRVTPEFLYFRDAFDFTTSVTTLSAQTGLWDGATGVVRANDWRLSQHGKSVHRTDQSLELNQELDASSTIGIQFSHSTTDSGGKTLTVTGTGAWSPSPRLTLRASIADNDPVNETLEAAISNITQTAAGAGADVTFGRGVSMQANVLDSRYSDANQRTFAFGQLSYRAPTEFDSNVRLRYEHLAYSKATSSYFSPNSFDLVRGTVEVGRQLTPQLEAMASIEAPYLIAQSRVGNGWTLSLARQWPHRAEVRLVVFSEHVPTAVPWSGTGCRVQTSLIF